MKTNWHQVGVEVEAMSIPAHIVDDFTATRDIGAFRAACRKIDVAEEAIDWRINDIEAWDL